MTIAPLSGNKIADRTEDPRVLRRSLSDSLLRHILPDNAGLSYPISTKFVFVRFFSRAWLNSLINFQPL